MGRDEVLPLVYKAVLGDVNTLFDVDETNRNIGLCEGAARQQDADWEKVKGLVEALRLLAEKGSYEGSVWSVPIRTWNVAQAVLAQLEEMWRVKP